MYGNAQTDPGNEHNLASISSRRSRHTSKGSIMAAQYLLHPAGTAQFHWDLKAGNGEVILSSQMYASKQNAETGIASCRTNSSDDTKFARLMSKDNKPYFVLKAANGEPIGTSQMYASEATRDHGIASCKENGPAAVMQDTAV
jgi:uncharacterized protein YegP (UPF0339 family)